MPAVSNINPPFMIGIIFPISTFGKYSMFEMKNTNRHIPKTIYAISIFIIVYVKNFRGGYIPFNFIILKLPTKFTYFR